MYVFLLIPAGLKILPYIPLVKLKAAGITYVIAAQP